MIDQGMVDEAQIQLLLHNRYIENVLVQFDEKDTEQITENALLKLIKDAETINKRHLEDINKNQNTLTNRISKLENENENLQSYFNDSINQYEKTIEFINENMLTEIEALREENKINRENNKKNIIETITNIQVKKLVKRAKIISFLAFIGIAIILEKYNISEYIKYASYLTFMLVTIDMWKPEIFWNKVKNHLFSCYLKKNDKLIDNEHSND